MLNARPRGNMTVPLVELHDISRGYGGSPVLALAQPEVTVTGAAPVAVGVGAASACSVGRWRAA
jgi:hypothetical protein